MATGYAGLDNPLFHMNKTMMVIGDAKNAVEDIVKAIWRFRHSGCAGGAIRNPDVCIGLGIKCVTPYEMLRNEKARFEDGKLRARSRNPRMPASRG